MTEPSETTGPTGVDLRLSARDGHSLGATWFSGQRPRATVVVNGAMAVPARFYRRFASWLAGAGLRVLTYDYRGVGASRPATLRGFRADLRDWAVLDAGAALDHALRHHPSEPVVLVGHSFGGQVIALLEEAGSTAGALLYGVGFPHPRDWPAWDRAKLALGWQTWLPLLTRAYGYLPGRFALREDLPRGVAEQWARWCADPRYLFGDHPEAQARLARWRAPVLLHTASDDWFAPEPSVSKLVRALPSAPLERRRLVPSELGVPAIGHFGFFHPRFSDTLWRASLRFVEDAAAGRAALRRSASREPWEITAADLAADLAYGRS